MPELTAKPAQTGVVLKGRETEAVCGQGRHDQAAEGVQGE